MSAFAPAFAIPAIVDAPGSGHSEKWLRKGTSLIIAGMQDVAKNFYGWSWRAHAMSSSEITALKRQVRILQIVIVSSLAAFTIAAVRPADTVLRATGLIIQDNEGKDRIIIGAPVPLIDGRRTDTTTSMVVRDTSGHDRVVLGEQPNPMINGKIMPRRDASWGMTIYNSAGDERGGMANFDKGSSAVSLDRPTGDGIGMLVDEKGDFSGLLLNYNSGKAGAYNPAVQVGTTGQRLVGNLWNFNGMSAGSIVAGEKGKAVTSSKQAM